MLNKARRTVPTSHEVWIAAARLLEQLGEPEERIDKTVATAVASLRRAGAVLSRDQWLQQAEQAEREGSALTCAAIVKATLHLDIDEEDRRRVWVEDAQGCLEKHCIETARAIYACALHEFPDAVSVWREQCSFSSAPSRACRAPSRSGCSTRTSAGPHRTCAVPVRC